MILIFGCINVNLPAQQQALPMPAQPFNQNMSEEEMLNKLMEEINNAIPEDQREAFWKEVEAETQRLEQATAHMNEEEKQAYLLGQMNAAMEQAEQAAPEPAVVVKEEKKEEKPKAKPAPVKEAVETSDILKSIVTSIHNFINKANAFPDFEGKVDRWAKQNLLSDWPAGQTWEQFKTELNKFSSLLQRFQEKDPKIGMKHIDALAKNEKIVQSLKQLETKLAREVPVIDTSVFAITRMSKKTKNAIAHVMNALTEMLYKIKANDALQKIIEEFDPAAKKLREEEEKAAKDALTKSQRPAQQVQVKTAGKATRKDDFFLPSFDDSSFSGGYSPYSGGGYGGYGGYGKGYDDYGAGAGAGMGGAGGSGGAGGKSGGKGASGSDITRPDDKKGESSKDKTPEALTTIKNAEVKEHVDNFKKEFSEAKKEILSIQGSV